MWFRGRIHHIQDGPMFRMDVRLVDYDDRILQFYFLHDLRELAPMFCRLETHSLSTLWESWVWNPQEIFEESQTFLMDRIHSQVSIPSRIESLGWHQD